VRWESRRGSGVSVFGVMNGTPKANTWLRVHSVYMAGRILQICPIPRLWNQQLTGDGRPS
jgi:hypothetical protein